MKKNINSFKCFVYKKFIMLFMTIFFMTNALADGSKDLYPNGARGHRAYLVGAHFDLFSEESIPFLNSGVHYVYVKEGETITMASSAQGYKGYKGEILLYSPDGKLLLDERMLGQIKNRYEEIAGPKLTRNSKSGYTPATYIVPKGGEGIYRVEFSSIGDSYHTKTVLANGFWEPNFAGLLMAWDISVVNVKGTAFIPGRVFTTQFNFSNGCNHINKPLDDVSYEKVKFNGKFYVRTHDGYTFRITHKGTSGILWSFFVNNTGFVDANGKSLYKSLDMIAGNAAKYIQNPNIPDLGDNKTYKIFYTLPATDMPESAKVSMGDGTKSHSSIITWLKSKVHKPEVRNLRIVGAEGSKGLIGAKGGYIEFDAPMTGQKYIINISNNSKSYVLQGLTKKGVNRVFWDGKSKEGVLFNGVGLSLDVEVHLHGAEIHFPLFDFEYNISGVSIELLDYKDLSKTISDKVFWDDSSMPKSIKGKYGGRTPKGAFSRPLNNSHLLEGNTGVSSVSNGHKWGWGAKGEALTFGDRRSMDTWTFIAGPKVKESITLDIKVADLYTEIMCQIKKEVNGSTANYGDFILYKVTVGNKGPNDIIANKGKNIKGAPFTFQVPYGVVITQVEKTIPKGAKEDIPIAYNEKTKKYHSELSLPNNSHITYFFIGKVVKGKGEQVAESTIIRPADVIDPDATNTDTDKKPTDPYMECNGFACNNISKHSFKVMEPRIDKCFKAVATKNFDNFSLYTSKSTSNIVERTFKLLGAEEGGVVEVYKLNKAFGLIINGVHLFKEELCFDSNKRNVRFKSDGKSWGDGISEYLFQVNRNYDVNTLNNNKKHTPLIRIVIDKWGGVRFYGKRTTKSNMEELEVFDNTLPEKPTLSLATVNWITEEKLEGKNEIVLWQTKRDDNLIQGFLYGLKEKECETCKFEKDGVFKDLNKDKFANIGEEITYTFNVINAGDMAIKDIVITDPLFGYPIKLNQSTKKPMLSFVTLNGDDNYDGILNENETWTFVINYKVTKEDVYENKGVYNRARVEGTGVMKYKEVKVDELSVDPTPYQQGDVGWSAEKPFHTYVPLEPFVARYNLMISNPHIYQKIR